MNNFIEKVKSWSPFGIGPHKERVIILISALVGIVAFVILIKRQNNTTDDTGMYGLGDGSGYAVDMAGSPSNVNGSGYVDAGTVAGQQPDIDVGDGTLSQILNNQFGLAYSQDTGIMLGNDTSVGQGGGGSTGGFSIGGGGFSLGFGNKTRAITASKANVQTVEARDSFQTDTQLINATPEAIASVETFLERVGGTAESRMQHQRDMLAMGEQTIIGMQTGKNIDTPKHQKPNTQAQGVVDYKLLNRVSTVVN